MPLLQSLICLKGHDNGRRFLTISLGCYLLLILLSSVLAKAAILVLLLLLIATPLIGTSAIRRIHDAGFATPLAAIPVAVYWLNLFGLTYFESAAKWSLLVLAAIASLAIGTLSNARVRRNHDYQLGYHGPVSVSKQDDFSAATHQRIEPTLTGKKDPIIDDDMIAKANDEVTRDYVQDSMSYAPQNSATQQWEQKLGQWLSQNKKLSIAVVSIILIVSIASMIMSDNGNDVTDDKKEVDNPVFVKQRLNKIELPDQFWIMLDQNDSLTIAWEGDIKAKDELVDGEIYWSAATGKGDLDCVDLHFSLGEDIRSLKVTVKNNGDYYADFSPVDTKLIVKSIADKDRFKLCGYEFELKGTRAALQKNAKYREYLKIGIN